MFVEIRFLTMKKVSLIVVLSLLCFTFSAFGNNMQPIAGPNCHIVHSAKSSNAGESYKNVSSKLLSSASVPDAVIFKNDNVENNEITRNDSNLTTLKTLHFYQNNVHDFAWFADKCHDY